MIFCLLIHLLLSQYFLQWHNDSINHVIEQAIIEAEKKGVEVFSLGLLNQASVNYSVFIFFFSFFFF